MARSPKKPAKHPSDKELMRWAVIENCRYWKLVDSELIAKIDKQTHRLCWEDVLLIFVEYNTGRGAFESGKCLSSATRLAAFINQEKLVFEQAGGLQQKAQLCAEIPLGDRQVARLAYP